MQISFLGFKDSLGGYYILFEKSQSLCKSVSWVGMLNRLQGGLSWLKYIYFSCSPDIGAGQNAPISAIPVLTTLEQMAMFKDHIRTISSNLSLPLLLPPPTALLPLECFNTTSVKWIKNDFPFFSLPCLPTL